jgi:hypothetical protein
MVVEPVEERIGSHLASDMTSRERRRHPRLPLPARIRVMHASFGSMVVSSRDISDGGVFISNGEQPYPPVGELVQVQALDMPVEAEVLDARIVRVESSGVGLEFCNLGD